MPLTRLNLERCIGEAYEDAVVRGYEFHRAYKSRDFLCSSSSRRAQPLSRYANMPVATFGSHESSMPSPPRNDENYSPSE